MKIKIIRQYDSKMKAIGELTRPSWQRYADKHGYEMETNVIEGQLEEANRKKLVAVRDAIRGDDGTCHNFFWADADSVVSNQDVKLESFIAKTEPEKHLIFDVSKYGLSTGNFFARNSTLAAQLLTAAINCGNAKPEVNAQYATINGADETTMKILILHFSTYERHVATMKIADFPSTHTPESFILHASQRDEAERIRLLSPYCK